MNLAFRARKAFETWQNDHDKTYKMPEVYKKLQDFCSQYQRTKNKTKVAIPASSAAANTGGTAAASKDTQGTSPPAKKVRFAV